MRIAIVNWSGGANDPFSYFSRQLQRQLEALGHEPHILALDATLPTTLLALHRAAPVHLAFTWQGLGSALRPDGYAHTLWALLGIPLVCLHGDHPCYNPANHQQSSPHLFHLYTCPSFARDANRLIRREWPAFSEGIVNFVADQPPPAAYAGDHFVFPKNLEHPEALRARWREQEAAPDYEALCVLADAITEQVVRGGPVDHHELMLELLPAPIPALVRAGEATPDLAALVFRLGRELDRVYRNVLAAHVVDALPHVPIRVNGSGWERHAARGNPNHQFRPHGVVADGTAQFHSAYGILDVAQASDTLHDRMLRAMRHGAGFLAGTSWRAGEPIHDGFAELFFDGSAEALATKAERVMADPEAHRARAAMFTQVFDAVFPFSAFIERVRGRVAARGFTLP